MGMSKIKTKFKEGDKVYWGQEKGIIIEIDSSDDYPIIVRFKDDKLFAFTLKGIYHGNIPLSLPLTFKPFVIPKECFDRPEELKSEIKRKYLFNDE